MNLYPIGRKVAVELDPPKKGEGGIQFVDEYPERWGTIVAVGGRCKNSDKNDRVMLAESKGIDVMVEGKAYVIVNETDLVAKD